MPRLKLVSKVDGQTSYLAEALLTEAAVCRKEEGERMIGTGVHTEPT